MTRRRSTGLCGGGGKKLASKEVSYLIQRALVELPCSILNEYSPYFAENLKNGLQNEVAIRKEEVAKFEQTKDHKLAECEFIY